MVEVAVAPQVLAVLVSTHELELRLHGLHVVWPHLVAHLAAVLHGILGIRAAVEEEWIVGQRSLACRVAVHAEEVVGAVGIHLGGYYGQGAVVSLLVAGSGHPGIGAVGASAVLDGIVACGLQYAPHLLGLPQVGVALIEAACVGASCFGQIGMRYGGHGAVVGAPSSVSGVEVDARLHVGRCRHGQADCSCQQYSSYYLSGHHVCPFVYCSLFGSDAFPLTCSRSAPPSLRCLGHTLSCVPGTSRRGRGARHYQT